MQTMPISIIKQPSGNDLCADDLILFAQVMSQGSFTNAAERVGLPPSTLSRRITNLENLLGERLLMRTTRKLKLTDFGDLILEHARKLVDEAEAAKSLALYRQETPQGTLRLSLPTEFRELFLDKVFMHFREKCPQVMLSMDFSSRRVDLMSERFDLAVRIAAALPDDNTLVARRIVPLRNGLYASPDYLRCHGTPITPEDLINHQGLVLTADSEEQHMWDLRRGDEHWRGLPKVEFSSNAVSLNELLAVAGMGIVALPDRVSKCLVEQGKLVPVLPDWNLPALYVWCVMPGRHLLPQRTRAFLDVFIEIMQSADSDGVKRSSSHPSFHGEVA